MLALDPGLRIRQSKDGVRKSDLGEIRSALEMYRSDKGGYPTTANFPACNAGTLNDGGSPVVIYMQKVPCDPKNSGQYVYTYVSDGSTYHLYSCLENSGDPQGDSPNDSGHCAGPPTNISYTLQNP
jgi:hypothetical protein